jgi:hypothetical protein
MEHKLHVWTTRAKARVSIRASVQNDHRPRKISSELIPGGGLQTDPIPVKRDALSMALI